MSKKSGGVKGFNRSEKSANKRMQNNYFTQQIKNMPQDQNFLDVTNVQQLRRNFPRIAKEMIGGNINYDTVWMYIADRRFLIPFYQFLNERFIEWNYVYNTLIIDFNQKQQQGQAVDGNAQVIIEQFRSRRDMAYLLLDGMGKFSQAPTPDYLRALSSSLNMYVRQKELFY